MKLIITCIAVILLSSNVELRRPNRDRVEDELEQFVPCYISSAPDDLLEVDQSGTEVNLGTFVAPLDTVDIPSIGYDGDACEYTLIILDTGYTSDDSCEGAEILALIVNLSDLSQIDTACAVVPYRAPSLIPGAGEKTILVILLRQERTIDTSCSELQDYPREDFSLECFAEEYDLCEPVAANYYTTGIVGNRKNNYSKN